MKIFVLVLCIMSWFTVGVSGAQAGRLLFLCAIEPAVNIMDFSLLTVLKRSLTADGKEYKCNEVHWNCSSR